MNDILLTYIVVNCIVSLSPMPAPTLVLCEKNRTVAVVAEVVKVTLMHGPLQNSHRSAALSAKESVFSRFPNVQQIDQSAAVTSEMTPRSTSFPVSYGSTVYICVQQC